MCGNMTVRTTSTSTGLKDKTNNINVSTNTQVRPLIYPSELTRLNNAKSTGNSIVVTFNNFPLKTKFTPSYKCPLYEFGQMDLTEVRSNVFFGSEIYYDLDERNYIVLDMPNEEQAQEATDGGTEDGGYTEPFEDDTEGGATAEAYSDSVEAQPAEADEGLQNDGGSDQGTMAGTA